MRRAEWTKGMKSLGMERIVLRYSRESHNRVVYEDADGRFWIDFYKQKVEVTRGIDKYITVDMY